MLANYKERDSNWRLKPLISLEKACSQLGGPEWPFTDKTGAEETRMLDKWGIRIQEQEGMEQNTDNTGDTCIYCFRSKRANNVFILDLWLLQLLLMCGWFSFIYFITEPLYILSIVHFYCFNILILYFFTFHTHIFLLVFMGFRTELNSWITANTWCCFFMGFFQPFFLPDLLSSWKKYSWPQKKKRFQVHSATVKAEALTQSLEKPSEGRNPQVDLVLQLTV